MPIGCVYEFISEILGWNRSLALSSLGGFEGCNKPHSNWRGIRDLPPCVTTLCNLLFSAPQPELRMAPEDAIALSCFYQAFLRVSWLEKDYAWDWGSLHQNGKFFKWLQDLETEGCQKVSGYRCKNSFLYFVGTLAVFTSSSFVFWELEVQLFCWLALSAEGKKPNCRLISKQLMYVSRGDDWENGVLPL